jgi:hypothetical protein
MHGPDRRRPFGERVSGVSSKGFMLGLGFPWRAPTVAGALDEQEPPT